MIKHRLNLVISLSLLGIFLTAIQVSSAPLFYIKAKNGMVSTQDHYASKVGLDVLKKGGNAVDAAYAIGYALAVTHPQAGNLGGGGFMVLYDANSDKTVALDYREKAPLAAHKDLFLLENGKVSKTKSRFSGLSIGVPGTVLGLETAHERYGRLDRKVLLDYAIKLAEKGFAVQNDLEIALKRYKVNLEKHEETKAVFFKGDNIYKTGDILKQPALAKTLKRIKKHGSKDFYHGKIAKQLVRYIKSKDGIITKDDLQKYQPVWRDVVTGKYKNLRIASMPPPSSGGIALIQSLNILSHFDIRAMGHNSVETIHIMSDTLKYVYSDRARYLGDTDFVDVPIKKLISKQYAETIANKISTQNIVNSDDVFQDAVSIQESTDTTHFVVVDKDGNSVSNTYTLNFTFGNGMLAPKLGFLLNNEMDDFSAKPGVPNAYGLIGNEQNSIEPEKRMLSSMTPTIVFKNNKPFIITGSPGGSQIITTVLQVILNVVDHGMTIRGAVSAKRFHHQGKPDYLFVEKGFSKETIKELKEKGFEIKETGSIGSAQSITRDDEGMLGAADPRKKNASALGL